MLAPLVSAACLVALSTPCSTTKAQASFRPYASGFSGVTAIVSTPAEPRRLYVVEQVGRIRYLVNGRLRGTFLDIRGRVASGGERGLLSVAFSPAYATNHRFYVNYTDLNGNTRVVEYRSRKGKAIRSSGRQILFVRQPYANHNGGELQFGPDKLLYVGMGDGGSAGDPGNRAQNLSIRLGKLMRANPYVRRPAWRIVAYGLRNPWRFSFDPANGDLYIADVGQGAWEEVDYRPGSQLDALTNYGWNLYEGRARYRSGSPNSAGQLAFPVAAYDHGEGCSITGGYVYRGRAVASAVGRYYYGDWCSGRLWSLRITGGSAEVRREPGSIGQLTTFGVDNVGELYAGTGRGRIYKLAP
jgi:glucose/arabinose dehydrogenase